MNLTNKTPKQIHDEAMNLYEQALVAKHQQDTVQFQTLTIQAFELEKEAAEMLIDRKDAEPTRSILFRSAATLAFHCDKLREAELLVAYGLTGNPSDEIANELRELWIQIFDKLKALKPVS